MTNFSLLIKIEMGTVKDKTVWQQEISALGKLSKSIAFQSSSAISVRKDEFKKHF